MLIHLATNVFSNPLTNNLYTSGLAMLWTLFLLWTLIEFAPGRIQLVTSNYALRGPVRVVVFKATRWHMKQLYIDIENRVWMWLNSQVLFGA